MNARHSSKSVEWYTPPEVVERARFALGGRIELDPASCELANRVVRAERFYSADGLAQDWTAATVLLNPPGGKIGNRSQAGAFWARLVQDFEAGRVGRAVFVAFSLEALQTSQTERGIFDTPGAVVCVPARRLAFVSPDGAQKSPTHANAIVGLGIPPCAFAAAFRGLGSIAVPLIDTAVVNR